jgi:hypothetical protein
VNYFGPKIKAFLKSLANVFQRKQRICDLIFLVFNVFKVKNLQILEFLKMHFFFFFFFSMCVGPSRKVGGIPKIRDLGQSDKSDPTFGESFPPRALPTVTWHKYYHDL